VMRAVKIVVNFFAVTDATGLVADKVLPVDFSSHDRLRVREKQERPEKNSAREPEIHFWRSLR